MIRVGSRGWTFFFNIGVVCALAVLTIPLFNHVSSHGFLGYSGGYWLFLAAYTIPLIVIVLVALALDARGNARLAISIIAAWVALEIAAQVIAARIPYQQSRYYRRPVPYMMFTGQPHSTWTDRGIPANSRGARSAFALNEYGFRGAAPRMPKPAGERRIFILGGSVVFNGVPAEESIAGHLERALRGGGLAGATVYNWGQVSYVSGQELALLVHRVVDLAPDLVIVLDGYNDLYTPYEFDPRPGYPFNFVTFEEGLDRVENQAPVYKLVATLLYKSTALRLIYARSQPDLLVPVGRARTEARYKTPPWESEIVRDYASNLQKMIALSKGFGFELAVCLQPPLVLKRSLAGRERVLLDGGDFDQYMRRQYGRVRADIARLRAEHAADSNVRVLDLSDLFSDVPDEIYWDPVHITNHGNAIVAGAIATRLLGADGLLQALRSGA